MAFLFFFLKQKTAYEMRISDWSSDVCSSDLRHPFPESLPERLEEGGGEPVDFAGRPGAPARDHEARLARGGREVREGVDRDRKSVGKGTSVSGRVDAGGRRMI